MSTVTPALATPLTLSCGVVLANRLAKSALSEQMSSPANAPSPGLERLYGRWARSGAALLITGNVMVDRGAINEPLNVAVQDERDLGNLTAWAAAATAGGTQAWVQINHPGRQSPRTLSRRPVAPSAVAVRGMGGAFATPRELTPGEIEKLIACFATTAGIVVRAGFGGVQIHAAHGFLISQFLSPLTNRRTDEWGGDPERRRRFLVEVVRAVRAEVGADVPVAVKLNSADFQHGGLTQEEALQVAAVLDEEAIDLLEISGGTYTSPTLLLGNPDQPQRASTVAREAYFLDFAKKVRAHIGTPLMLTGGFRSRAAMEDALGTGAVDLVGLARPMALEPELPARLLADSAAASSVRPRRIGIRKLDGITELAWHTEQLWRMGRGQDPDPGRHPLRSTLRYLGASGRDSLRRRLRRAPSDPVRAETR